MRSQPFTNRVLGRLPRKQSTKRDGTGGKSRSRQGSGPAYWTLLTWVFFVSLPQDWDRVSQALPLLSHMGKKGLMASRQVCKHWSASGCHSRVPLSFPTPPGSLLDSCPSSPERLHSWVPELPTGQCCLRWHWLLSFYLLGPWI